jgi:plasmid stability protein
MANLHVRNVPEEVVKKLKQRAARHGRSTEAEHREILREAVSGEQGDAFEELAARLRKLTEGRNLTPSEDLVRESRDER